MKTQIYATPAIKGLITSLTLLNSPGWQLFGGIPQVPPNVLLLMGGGPRVVVSTAAFHARVRGSFPGFGGLKETKNVSSPSRVKVSIVGSLSDREEACSASDHQGSNF